MSNGDTMREPPSGDGSGFNVDPATLSGVAGLLGSAYDELNAAFGSMIDGSDADVSVFGDPDVVQPWSDFCTDYFAELQVDSAALAELISKLMTTAQRYQETEANVTGAVKGAGAA